MVPYRPPAAADDGVLDTTVNQRLADDVVMLCLDRDKKTSVHTTYYIDMSTTASAALGANTIQYLDLTHKLNEYNELHGVNQHLQRVASQDLARLEGTHEELRAHILKKQQEYLLTNFAVQDVAFRGRVLVWTGIIAGVFVLAAAAVASGKASPSKAKAILIGCASVATLYFVALIVMAKRHADRRKTAYDQFYWIDKKATVT